MGSISDDEVLAHIRGDNYILSYPALCGLLLLLLACYCVTAPTCYAFEVGTLKWAFATGNDVVA